MRRARRADDHKIERKSSVTLFFGFYLVYEVTYVMDRTAYLATDVGFGTRVWRGGELSPHSPGGRTRGIDYQRSSGTTRYLALSI